MYIENICNVSVVLSNPLQNQIINSERDIKYAVKALRTNWDIGQDAIHNIIDLLEDNNIKVIEVEEAEGNFDGLATIIDNKYHVIVINKNMQIERKRFTLLHDLAHLLLPISSLEVKQQEKYCNAFASEMLLSEQNAKNELGENRSRISFEEFKKVQEKYGISISAVVYKLGTYGMMSQDRVKKFYMNLNFDKNLKILVEQTRFDGVERSNKYENLVYRAVSEELISMSKASSLLQISLEDLKNKLSVNIR